MTCESPSPTITVTTHHSLADIGAEAWDACACPEASDGGRPNDPFTTYRFLKALEDSHSVGPRTGWDPHYLTAELDDDLFVDDFGSQGLGDLPTQPALLQAVADDVIRT